MKILLKPNGILPTRAHPTDAGLDLYAPHDFKIGVRGYRRINTAFALSCRRTRSALSRANPG